jgi:hypothetical protein
MLTSGDRRQPFANMPAFMQQQMQVEQQMQAQRAAQQQEAASQEFRQGLVGGGGDMAGGMPAGEGGGEQQPSTGNRTLDALFAQHRQITNAMVNAPTKEDFDRAKAMRDNIEAQISRYEKEAGGPTDLARLRRERDALPPDHPDRPLYDQRIERLGQGPQTTVNVGGRSDPQWGDPESGNVWLRDDAGNVITEPDPSGRGVRPVQVPIAGGSIEDQRQTAERERSARARTTAATGATLLDEVTGAYGLRQALGFDPETGEYGRPKIASPRIRKLIADNPDGVTALLYAGSETSDFLYTLDSLKDTIGIQRLLEIKEAGSGLGAVPAEQLRQLARALGALEAGASNELLRHNIDRVRVLYEDIVRRSLEDERDDTFRGMITDMSPYVGEITGQGGASGGGRAVTEMSDEELLRALGGQ